MRPPWPIRHPILTLVFAIAASDSFDVAFGTETSTWVFLIGLAAALAVGVFAATLASFDADAGRRLFDDEAVAEMLRRQAAQRRERPETWTREGWPNDDGRRGGPGAGRHAGPGMDWDADVAELLAGHDLTTHAGIRRARVAVNRALHPDKVGPGHGGDLLGRANMALSTRERELR